VASEVAVASPYGFAAAVAAATFTVLNLLLLGASYWAVRETVEVTNGDLAAKSARFAEASPARNVVFVIGTAVLLVMQIAVVVDWVQQARAVALVATDGAIGPRYLNFLLATVDSLPLAAFYVAPLSRHAWFAPDLPALALARSLNALGSILIVSTALGLVQQRLAFQRMVEGLVNSRDAVFPAALLARFRNAPSAIKGYVMNAFRSETDDDRRLRLARLAIARTTYTFPQVFAANYTGYSEKMRREGAQIVADFIGDRNVTFYVTTLQNFFDACDHTQRRGGFRAVEERRRIAPAYINALERMVDLDGKAADARIRTVLAQKILIAVVRTRSNFQLSERAANLLARINSYEAVAPLLNSIVWFSEATTLAVLARITRTLGDKSIVFPPARNLDLLKRMAAAGRSANAHRTLLSPAASESLDKAMEKLDRRLAAAAAEIDRQRKRREKAEARRRDAAKPRAGRRRRAHVPAAPAPSVPAAAPTLQPVADLPATPRDPVAAILALPDSPAAAATIDQASAP
jgi:hypothetical protein